MSVETSMLSEAKAMEPAQPGIQDALAVLDKSLDGLGEAVDGLVGRIDPVLLPSEPQDIGGASPDRPVSPVHERISGLIRAADRIAAHVRTTTRRVDLG